MYVRLVRELDDGLCTIGRLFLPKGGTLFTLERPWKNNENGVSCIPCGTYRVIMCQSPHLGRVYWITDVPGRSVIRIHWGNIVEHVQGCVLLGLSRGRLRGERAVFQSVTAVHKFMSLMQEQEFQLEVR